jgi:hypothetical protein
MSKQGYINKKVDFSEDAKSKMEDLKDSVVIPIKTFICILNETLISMLPFLDKKNRFNSIMPSLFVFLCIVYSLFRFFFVLQFCLEDKEKEAKYYYDLLYPIQFLFDILQWLLIFNHGYDKVIAAPAFIVGLDFIFFTFTYFLFNLTTYMITAGITLLFSFPLNCYILFAVFMSYLYPKEPAYTQFEKK